MAAVGGKANAKPTGGGADFHLPTTRYYGSKRRQVEWIASRLRKFQFESVLDAFGGTGTVSLLLSKLGKTVTYHDAFHFNGASARALLLHNEVTLNREELQELLKSTHPRRGFISRTFNGIFYPSEENNWLDGFLHAVDASEVSGLDLDIVNYCLFQACLQKRPYNMFHRANLNLRIAEGVKRSFGNATTWETPFSELMMRAFDELALARSFARRSTIVMEPGAVMDIKPGFDLVYLDPPYLRSKTPETYLNRYHFLEGLARRQEWSSLLSRESGCRFFRKDYLRENWEDPKTIEHSLDALVERHAGSMVALSYMENGVPSINAIRKIFRRHFSKHAVYRMPINYALSKRKNSEVLIIGGSW